LLPLLWSHVAKKKKLLHQHLLWLLLHQHRSLLHQLLMRRLLLLWHRLRTLQPLNKFGTDRLLPGKKATVSVAFFCQSIGGGC